MNPLTKTNLLSLIALGENSAVEFKRDELRPEHNGTESDLLAEGGQFTVHLWRG